MYRIPKLYQQETPLFHTQDLALLWEIKNRNTLYTTIKRYIKRGVLFQIYKGLYSLYPPKKLDPIMLGLFALRRYGYLSCEYVLFQEGIIFQEPQYITLISDKPARFQIKDFAYKVRQLRPVYLYNEVGLTREKNYKKAGVERAVADLLYFDSNYHFDNPRGVNWEKVKKIQKAVGF